MAIPEFKVILEGDGGVGKSSLIRRHLTGEFENKYVPTVGAEVRRLEFATSYGPVAFNVWECAGNERWGGLRDGYYLHGQCAIIMFDVTSRITYKNLPNWHRSIVRVCNAIPIVVIGNKVDSERKVQARHMKKFREKRNLQHYDVSVRTCYNFEKPFLWLARRLSNRPDLEFVSEFAMAPEIQLDIELIAHHAMELQKAQNVSVGVDDDVDADLETDLVLTLYASPPAGDGLVLVACVNMHGSEVASLYSDMEREVLVGFRARLASHLGVTGRRLHLVAHEGRLLTKRDSSTLLSDIFGAGA